jgi:hypothetical protein
MFASSPRVIIFREELGGNAGEAESAEAERNHQEKRGVPAQHAPARTERRQRT